MPEHKKKFDPFQDDIKDLQFYGKRVGDMSRDELLGCIQWCYRRIDEHFSPENMDLRAYGRIEKLRRENECEPSSYVDLRE